MPKLTTYTDPLPRLKGRGYGDRNPPLKGEPMSYNGWSNYETWCVNLWISNEQSTDTYARKLAQEAFDDAEADRTFSREERAAINLSDALKGWVESEMIPDMPNGLASDLLGAAMSEVDWYEIAQHYIADLVDA